MKEALVIFGEIEAAEDPELGRSKDEMLLIQARYLIALGNIEYIKGDYTRAQEAVEKAWIICNNAANYTYETQEEFKKHLKEL
jgi:hypothetical protein